MHAEAPFALVQDLTVPGANVDINMHPTKREVGLLHQTAIQQAICEHVDKLFMSTLDRCDCFVKCSGFRKWLNSVFY